MEQELAATLKLALGQLEGSQPLSGVHASSLQADIKIIRETLSKYEQEKQG